jgi:hypothetical protein
MALATTGAVDCLRIARSASVSLVDRIAGLRQGPPFYHVVGTTNISFLTRILANRVRACLSRALRSM